MNKNLKSIFTIIGIISSIFGVIFSILILVSTTSPKEIFYIKDAQKMMGEFPLNKNFKYKKLLNGRHSGKGMFADEYDQCFLSLDSNIPENILLENKWLKGPINNQIEQEAINWILSGTKWSESIINNEDHFFYIKQVHYSDHFFVTKATVYIYNTKDKTLFYTESEI